MENNKPLHMFLLVIFAIIIFFVVIYIDSGYSWPEWTGFGTQTITIQQERSANDIESTNSPNQFQIILSEKTLWDWMELLIAPIVLAGLIAVFNWIVENSQNKFRHELSKITLQIEADQKLSKENFYNEIFQNYLFTMNELLVNQHLSVNIIDKSSSIRSIAQIFTINTLRLIDLSRRNYVLQFLRDAKLEKYIFVDAILTNINLSYCDLSGFNFTGAKIDEADFSNSILIDTIFSDKK